MLSALKFSHAFSPIRLLVAQESISIFIFTPPTQKLSLSDMWSMANAKSSRPSTLYTFCFGFPPLVRHTFAKSSFHWHLWHICHICLSVALSQYYGMDQEPLPGDLSQYYGMDQEALPLALSQYYGMDREPLPVDLSQYYGMDQEALL